METVDEETEHWPIATEHRKFLDNIKYDYRIQPLPVYAEDDTYIQPKDVVNRMRDSLVEVHFRIKHYRIGRDASSFDSFSGVIEQVVILKPGIPKRSSPYSKHRANIENGLYKPKPSVPANHMLAQSFAKTPEPQGKHANGRSTFSF